MGTFGDLVGGADRHRGLDDQGAVAVHEVSDLAGDRQYMAQVCRTVFIGWRAYRDEDQFAVIDRIAGLITEQQPATLDVLFEQFGQPRLADRWHRLLQLTNLVGVNVDAQNAVADVSQRSRLNQSHVPRTKYAHVHFWRASQDG